MAVFLPCILLMVIQFLPTSSNAQDCDYQIQLLTRNSYDSQYNRYEGQIQVICNGSSFSPYICDDPWTAADATVACRQLGFSALGAVPRKHGYFSFGYHGPSQYGPALLSDIVCNGNESYLVDCQHSSVRTRTCERSRGVGVSCLPLETEPMCRDGDVRLVGDGSSTTEGYVQFCYGSVWGSVCANDPFDDNAARVVCKQLGLSNIGIKKTFYFLPSEDIYTVLRLSGNGCTGDESRFADCSAFPLGDTYRVYSCNAAAGVQCITGLLLVQKLSGGEIFAILFCSLLFVGSIIVLVLGLAYYKQRQYKKLVRTHSPSGSSSDILQPATSEAAQRVEQVGVATHDEPSPNQNPTHSASEPPPPAYCETSESSEQCHTVTETDHPEQSLV